LATLYDDEALDRIRALLVAHMQSRKMGTPTAEQLTHVPRRTVHRLITGERVNDGALQLIEKFLARLPNKPTVLQAFGESIYKFFGHAPKAIAGIYRISIAGFPVSELTIKYADASLTWYRVAERSTAGLLRVYEGSLVFSGRSALAVLKDQLMRTARVHMLHFDTDPGSMSGYGLVYDDGNLPRGAVPYQMLQTTLEFIKIVE
jgi:hypothetical protein